MLDELQSGLLKIRPVLLQVVADAESRTRLALELWCMQEREFQVLFAAVFGSRRW